MAKEPDPTAQDAGQAVTPAPGEKVTLTPGAKTVRLTPGVKSGRVPGENTVRLEAATRRRRPRPATKKAPEPSAEAAGPSTGEKPAVPAEPAVDELPETPPEPTADEAPEAAVEPVVDEAPAEAADLITEAEPEPPAANEPAAEAVPEPAVVKPPVIPGSVLAAAVIRAATPPKPKARKPSASIHSTEKPVEAGNGDEAGVIPVGTAPGPVADETVVMTVSAAVAEPVVLPVPAVARPTIVPILVPARPTDAATLRRLPRANLLPAPPVAAVVAPSRPLDSLEPERERRVRSRGSGLGQAPWILALSSLGVLVVALAYAGGRYEVRHAMVAYWMGQVLVFTPVVLRLLSRRLTGVAESFLLVLGLALNQYLLKWCYSPDQFRFPDELQHWLATTIINDTGALFRPNPALPPAVHFPGLAEMGAAVSQLTGLSVFVSGILVAGVAHLCFVVALFALVLRAGGSPTIAGVACVVYATTLHYLFFNSMYLYQTAALPFFMITVWAVRRWRAGGGRPFLAISVVATGLTVVSHHVTAGALVCTLLLLGLTEVVADRSRPWRALIPAAIAAVLVSAWILLVARDVIAYLEAPLDQVMQTASMFVTDHADATTVTPAVSLWELAVQAVGLLGLLVLFLALARDTLARGDRDPWRWSILVGSAVFFAGQGVRLLGTNGPEIAARLSTFTYVPIAVVAAIALVQAPKLLPGPDGAGRRCRAVSPVPPVLPGRPALTPRVLAGGAIVTVLMVGARAAGWPPPTQLLPGPYLAAGFERSVDAYGVDAAEWQYSALGPGNRVGGDIVAVSLASTYGRQDPVREVGTLFYDDIWSNADQGIADDLALRYLVVDERLTEQLPTNQAYFESDPHAGRITAPLTRGQIGKFDSLPRVDRLYDNGKIRIYRMGPS